MKIAVVLACHADESLSILADPSPQESRLLIPWTYSLNRTVLHTDTSFLPSLRKVWSSWNYVRSSQVQSGSPVMLTYHMNRLQNLSTKNQYCATLNPKRSVGQGHVVRDMVYSHPIYSPESLSSQLEIHKISGQRNTHYCGSSMGYGFHEDAVKSAVAVARSMGVEL
ncbi:MAG TPA: hypothetical protein ENN05_04395 [Deltaproteobacteria bacterium]|nr:hypothetical protein [Deltaproteobacteria bacterium]